MKFEELSIAEYVLRGIEDAGFKECTQVQEAVLPKALKGEDVAAQAQTGTGKTAAFLIALFTRLLEQDQNEPERKADKGPPSPRALIIAPTRELVTQIHADALLLGKHTPYSLLPVFGGVDYQKQREALSKGVDIVIGTPGRLIDYLKQKVWTLKRTGFLVIDEADRMFDMGFISDLRYILRRMPPFSRRQSMLLSATLTHRVMELCYEHMNLKEKISLTPEKITVDEVTQELYHVGKEEKDGILLGLLKRESFGRTVVFVNTKHMAERIEGLLRVNGYNASAITGDIPQKKRLSVLSRFKEGEISILVATDVASRGLHIEDVTHVINYDLPQDSQDYVHRIGRTARAGAKGKAISLACETYVYSLEDIEDYIKQKLPAMPVEEGLILTGYAKPQKHGRRRPSEHGAASGRRTSGGPSRRETPGKGKSSRRPRRSKTPTTSGQK